MVVLDVAIMSVAPPSIREALGFGQSRGWWRHAIGAALGQPWHPERSLVR